MERVEKYYTPEKCRKPQSWCDVANVYAFLNQAIDPNHVPIPWSESRNNILNRSEQDLHKSILIDVERFGTASFAETFPQPEMIPFIRAVIAAKDVTELCRREFQLGRKLGVIHITHKEQKQLKLEKKQQKTEAYNEWTYEWYDAFEKLKDQYGLGCVSHPSNRYTFVCDTDSGRSGRALREFYAEHNSKVGIGTAFARLCGAEYPSKICKLVDLSPGDTFRHIGELLRIHGAEHTYVVGGPTDLHDGSSARICVDNKFPGVGSAFRDTDYVVKVG